MEIESDHDVLPGQFVSLLAKLENGNFKKAYPGKIIEVYFLEEFPNYTDEQKKEVNKHMAKKESDASYDFRKMSDEEREQTKAAFEAISKVTGLQFVYPGKSTEGGIRIGSAKTIFENGEKESGGQF